MRKSKWQKKLEENVRTLEELEKYIDLQKSEKKLLQEVVKVHPMNITQYQLSLIDKNDPNDPIRKMLIPSVAELDTSGEYDTSGEKENTKSIGLQHKYRQTVLLLVTNG